MWPGPTLPDLTRLILMRHWPGQGTPSPRPTPAYLPAPTICLPCAECAASKTGIKRKAAAIPKPREDYELDLSSAMFSSTQQMRQDDSPVLNGSKGGGGRSGRGGEGGKGRVWGGA